MNASTLSFRAATIFAVAGISMGIAMAVMRDHAIMPAHAHLNLLGWVSLFLFGIYYRLTLASTAADWRSFRSRCGPWEPLSSLSLSPPFISDKHSLIRSPRSALSSYSPTCFFLLLSCSAPPWA
jgi:hypothetical protein